jgi:hypothetical protein
MATGVAEGEAEDGTTDGVGVTEDGCAEAMEDGIGVPDGDAVDAISAAMDEAVWGEVAGVDEGRARGAEELAPHLTGQATSL